MRLTVCVDLDGTICEAFDPERPGRIGALRPGAREVVNRLAEEFDVVVLTARGAHQHRDIERRLAAEGLQVAGVTSEKVPAVAYVDDRAVPCDSWEGVFEAVLRLAPSARREAKAFPRPDPE